MPIQARRASECIDRVCTRYRVLMFEVAILFRQRANGPAIYLAQPAGPAGLGFHADKNLGLKARPLNRWKLNSKKLTAGPLALFFFGSIQFPALQAGLDKRTGLCP